MTEETDETDETCLSASGLSGTIANLIARSAGQGYNELESKQKSYN